MVIQNSIKPFKTYEFTEEEVKDAGYVFTDVHPNYNDETHKCKWSGTDWVVSSLSDSEILAIKNAKWKKIRVERDAIIKDEQWYIEKYNSEVRRGVTPTVDITKVDAYVESLRQIPQTQTDPDNIIWPDHWLEES